MRSSVIPDIAAWSDGRLVYMPSDLKRLVVAQVDRVRILGRKIGRVTPSYSRNLVAGELTGGDAVTIARRGR